MLNDLAIVAVIHIRGPVTFIVGLLGHFITKNFGLI